MKKFNINVAQYIKDYKFNSIFVKNLINLFMLIIIPLFGLFALTFYSYNNIQANEIKAYNEGYITKLSAEVDRIINESRSQLSYICFSPDVELYMLAAEDSEELFYNASNIYRLISLPVISTSYVNSLYIYSPKKEKVLQSQGMASFETFSDKSCIENYFIKGFEFKKHTIDLSYDTRTDSPQIQLSIYHSIDLGQQNSGMAVLNINLKELGGILDTKSDKLYITDDKQILYSKNQSEIGQRVDTIANYSELISQNGQYNKDNFISVKSSAETGLNVISYSSKELYGAKLSQVRYFMIVFVIGLTAVSIVMSFLISVKIFNPIKTIMMAINKNKTILLENEVTLNEQNELRYIISSIEKSADKNRHISNELQSRLQILKKAQSIALQSQINPHFINNTLETINFTAITLLGKENDISMMTGALSKMLRLALENTDTIIPINDEITHVKMYLTIQKRRYQDKFDVIWDIDKEVLKYKTIKIILQPIIENAIYHGIKPLFDRGTIKISGKIEEDIVYIVVYDDGLGMSEIKLHELNMKLKNDTIKENDNIGLVNVNQRIRIYFGSEFGLTIASNEGMGTQVTIKLPLIK